MSGIPLGVAGWSQAAILDERGSLTLSGSDVVVRWWVGDIDGWHRDAAATVRQEFIESTPVVESRLRIHRGDARATSFAALSATGASVVVTELKNRTPSPVVVAVVVGPHRSCAVEDATVQIDDVSLVLGRPPSHVLRAVDLESMANEIDRHTAAVAAGESGDGIASATGVPRIDDRGAPSPPRATWPTGDVGYTALLVPVPHTRSLGWSIGMSGRVVGPADLPTSEQVVSGWTAHADRRPLRWAAAQTTDAEWFAATSAMLSMESWSTDWCVGRLASWSSAAVRLGIDFDADALSLELVARQSRKGAWGSGEARREITLDAVDALLGPWRLGVPAHLLEQSFVPLLRGLDWLERHRDGSSRHADLRSITAEVLEAAGQQRAATDVSRPGSSRSTGSPAVAGSLAATGSPFPTNALGLDADVDGVWDAVAAARRIVSTVDGEIAVGSGLDVCRSWSPAEFGLSREIHGVPTQWGPAGIALRWHGKRPALLWEVLPWAGVERSSPPSITASALAPSWSGEGWSGEALLPEPVGMVGPEEISDFA